MSTRSSISINNNDGTITSVYCHNNGYLRHNGQILIKYYNTKDKVKELISLGDMSCLENKIYPDLKKVHSFNDRQENVCFYYHRDRKEEWEDNIPIVFKLEEFSKHNEQLYNYLFDNGKWYWKLYNDKDWKELTQNDIDNE